MTKLAADPKTQAEALNLFRTETAGILEQYMTPFRKLTDLERADFEKASRDSDATYASARNTIVAASVAALIAGILLAITLARSITASARAMPWPWPGPSRTASSTTRSTSPAKTKPASC